MRTLNILTEIGTRFIRFIVSILANFLNIIVSLIIILLNVYVSWNHTLELFHEAGFTRAGYMDIAGVCAVELTFLLGSCHVIGSRMRGQVPGIGSIITGGLGVALIMWSNISAGVSHGITGIIIGIVVPLSIIACETILADAWREQAKAEEPIQQNVATEETIPTIDKSHEATVEPTHKEPEASQHKQEEEESTHKENEESETVTQSPREWAINFYKQNEKLPSIRKLAEAAGISEWKARKVREELKIQLG